MHKTPKVIVVFFGLNRGASISSQSIVDNILNENQDLIRYKILSINLLDKITNVRNGENNVPIDKQESFLIEADTYLLNKQNGKDIEKYIQFAEIHGDSYENNWVSISGSLHQLLSLKRAWAYIEANVDFVGDLFLFLRSDLVYLNKFNILEVCKNFRENGNIAIPDWHHFGGLNDRFALCDYYAAKVYANRIDLVSEYSLKRKLHPESLLAYSLSKMRIKICELPVKAKRVRAGNVIKEEDFSLCQKNLTSEPQFMD